MSIEEDLKNLIAEQEGVRPEEVTVQWIEQQRAKKIYPCTKFYLEVIKHIPDYFF